MAYDIFLANQWFLVSWVGVFFVLVAIHFLTRKAAAQTGEKEAHNFVIGWMWTVFWVVTILMIVSLAINQSINWTPRQAEDRNGAEQDQQKFERRIKEKQK